MGEQGQQSGVSPVLANPARIYDALLGGKDNFAVDRAAVRKLTRIKPDLSSTARSNRRFLGRVVRYLAETAGIGQFLDIGAGFPAMNNTYEVAQRHDPAARVVYVDNDPVVLAHGRALLTSTPEGQLAFVKADLRDPACVLASARKHLDFAEPVAVMLLGVLDLIGPDDDPYGTVARLLAAIPPGSHLAVSHPASDVQARQAARGAVVFSQVTGLTQTNRSHEEVGRFFAGLKLIDPGLVELGQWHPDGIAEPAVPAWGAVGYKPG